MMTVQIRSLIMGIGMASRTSLVIISLTVGLLSACTTVTEHSGSIETFAKAAEQASSALKAYDRAGSTRLTALNKQAAEAAVTNHTGFVANPPKECVPNSATCA